MEVFLFTESANSLFAAFVLLTGIGTSKAVDFFHQHSVSISSGSIFLHYEVYLQDIRPANLYFTEDETCFFIFLITQKSERSGVPNRLELRTKFLACTRL